MLNHGLMPILVSKHPFPNVRNWSCREGARLGCRGLWGRRGL